MYEPLCICFFFWENLDWTGKKLLFKRRNFQFFIILIIVFCLQLACAVVAYTQQDFIRRYIDNSMYEAIQEYYAINPQYRDTFDRIQNEVRNFCKNFMDFMGFLYGWTG